MLENTEFLKEHELLLVQNITVSGKLLKTEKKKIKKKISPIFKKGKLDLGNYRSQLNHRKMQQLLLEATSRQGKDNKVTGSSQHVLMKGKWCLTNLIAF